MLAPPAFLVSARYPILHGAPVDVPLISLLRDIEFTWEGQILEGQKLRSSTRQGEVREIFDRSGHRRKYIEGLRAYWSGEDHSLGRALSTVVRMLDQGDSEIDAWAPQHYSDAELCEITEAIASEARTGARRSTAGEFSVGMRLPTIVRGFLTIGDMVCWHSAVGPSYRPGPIGYRDTVESPSSG